VSEQDLGFDAGAAFASDQLVQAREALGLSAEAIQRELRLASRVVIALEKGNLEGMGQPVFARGYIRSYCKRVGLDADPFVAQYDAIVGSAEPKRVRSRDTLAGATSAPASMTLTRRPSAIPRILAGLVKVLLLVAVLGGIAFGISKSGIDLSGFSLNSLFGDAVEVEADDPNRLAIPGAAPAVETRVVTAPQADSSATVNPQSADDAEPTAVAQEPSVESVIESVAEAVETPDAVSSQPLPEVQTEVVSSLEIPQAVEQVTDVPSLSAQAESPVEPQVQTEEQVSVSESQTLADGSARVSIEFTDVSWVNIKDGKGGALFNGLAERGRKLELSGPVPINFVIGRADAVSTLTFNGSTVDLEPFTRKNVARLTLPR